MAVKARSYGAANLVLTVLGIIAWLQIGVGLLGIFARGLGGDSQLEVFLTIVMKLISAITVLSGLVSLALVQMARANVHNAEINWEMLQLLRQTAGGQPESRNPNVVLAPISVGPKMAGERIKSFKGREILKQSEGVSVDGVAFKNVIEAERYISEQEQGSS